MHVRPESRVLEVGIHSREGAGHGFQSTWDRRSRPGAGGVHPGRWTLTFVPATLPPPRGGNMRPSSLLLALVLVGCAGDEKKPEPAKPAPAPVAARPAPAEDDGEIVIKGSHDA